MVTLGIIFPFRMRPVSLISIFVWSRSVFVYVSTKCSFFIDFHVPALRGCLGAHHDVRFEKSAPTARFRVFVSQIDAIYIWSEVLLLNIYVNYVCLFQLTKEFRGTLVLAHKINRRSHLFVQARLVPNVRNWFSHVASFGVGFFNWFEHQ
jgi:uncharacterized membrane protein (DUF485 family)